MPLPISQHRLLWEDAKCSLCGFAGDLAFVFNSAWRVYMPLCITCWDKLRAAAPKEP